MTKPLLALFAFLLVAASPTMADELRLLAGKSVSGELRSVDGKQVVFETAEGEVTTPLSQVLSVQFAAAKPIPADAKYSDIHLIDDTVLHCRDVRFSGTNVTLTLLSGTKIQLPLSAVASFVRDADNATLRKKFQALATQKIRGDRVVILRDGELSPLDGTLGDVDAQGKTIQFKREGVDVAVQIDRLHGMVFFRPEGSSETPIAKVSDRDGNLLTVSRLGFENKTWSLKTTFGADLTLPVESVALLDFNLGKLTYLSDLAPSRVLERSLIGLVVKHRRDANLDGEPILMDRRYAKGLSMHAHTELEYDLGGKYKDLKGTLGVDTRTGPESRPIVTIYCDGEKRFSETITAGKIRPINLNVKDVATLKIVVSSQNEFDLHDHVTFAEARVSQ